LAREDFLHLAVEILKNAQYLIALTGSGISKESNIPTFRGKDGLWKNYDVTQLATPMAFHRNPKLVWEWYTWRQGLISKAVPNPAHKILVKWEQQGRLQSILTQNVDGLHRRAGSIKVLEVHGNIFHTKCTVCSFTGTIDKPMKGIPTCPKCRNQIRPNVVWFGESLDSRVLSQVSKELEQSDVCLVIGTSGIVQPAASFPLIVKQNRGKLIEINTESTPLTRIADVHLQGKAGEILPELDSLMLST
jgi:NAD-dependent deacetylase